MPTVRPVLEPTRARDVLAYIDRAEAQARVGLRLHQVPPRFVEDLKPNHLSHRANTPSGLSIEGFIEKFDYLVKAVIIRTLPRHMLAAKLEDLRQQIWMEFIKGGYINIYDPRRASPRTFVFEFTVRRVKQHLSKSNRTPTDNAFSIQNQDEDVFEIGIVDPETTKELGLDEQATLEFNDLAARATEAIHRQRQRGRRDLPWVFYLARRGYRQDEIAKEMGLSEGTISICMDLIRQIPEVQELRTWAAEIGLLQSGPLSTAA